MTKSEVTNDEIMSMLSQFANSVDGQFQSIDKRLFRMEGDIVEMKRKVIDLRASHDRLLNTVDKFIGRIDTYEAEQAARDSQFQRLLD